MSAPFVEPRASREAQRQAELKHLDELSDRLAGLATRVLHLAPPLVVIERQRCSATWPSCSHHSAARDNSRDVIGQTPFGWSLDEAMEGLAPRLERIVERTGRDRPSRIVIDLSGCEFLASAGLSALTRAGRLRTGGVEARVMPVTVNSLPSSPEAPVSRMEA